MHTDLPTRTTSPAERAEVTALIPAAGRVPEGVLALSNIASPAMIPVGGRPVIYWTLKTLTALGVRRVRMAVASRGQFVEDFVHCVGNTFDTAFLVPGAPSGVLRTVLDLLEKTETRKALIVLGDTAFELPDAALLDGDSAFVLVSDVSDSYRWCVAEVGEGGEVTALRDKQAALPLPAKALIGVYFLPDVPAAREIARELVRAAEARGAPTEFAPFLEALRQLPGGLKAVQAASWIDCGNPDQQAASHRALLQKRSFNELAINPVLGSITKRSRNVEKFVDEINYLRLLPPDISSLFPRVLSFSTDWGDPYVTLEYYGYPTLSEMFVYENIDPGIWEQVFIHLRTIAVDEFGRYRAQLPKDTLVEMVLGKTRARLAMLHSSPESNPDLLELIGSEAPLMINGVSHDNLDVYWPRITAAVHEMSETSPSATIVHGDLCFSNILYDLRSRIIKLVDPRGSFGRVGVYGDIRYDIAKLYHSVAGGYDLIVNDLFDIAVDGSRRDVSFRLHSRAAHDAVADRFRTVFFGHFQAREITLLTALLFASMIPLHAESPRRQLAMYVRALELLHAWKSM